MKFHPFAIGLLVCSLAGIGEETNALPVSEGQAGPPSARSAAAAPIRWTVPAGWRELAPTAVRIGNFFIPFGDGRGAEGAVTAFPGTVGTELDNVNRWRGEVGLPATGDGAIKSWKVTVDGSGGKLYDIAGPSGRTVVASVPRGGVTWFFKLRGDPAAVAAAKKGFTEFLKSVRFTAESSAAASGGVLGSAAAGSAVASGNVADPHAGLELAGAAHAETEPQWTPPANWIATPAGAMVVKAFKVPGENGAGATVAISTFFGEAGGTFANVNRWRRQLTLAPVGRDELGTVTQPIAVEGGKAVLVDFTGTDPKSSKPARMVAAIVAVGDGTWFYKLVGDVSLVEREKSRFVHFVQTVRYP